MNDDRATNALLKILDIAEHQYRSLALLADELTGGLQTGAIARKVIADRCTKTADLIGERM